MAKYVKFEIIFYCLICILQFLVGLMSVIMARYSLTLAVMWLVIDTLIVGFIIWE